ncbi:MAG: calcium/sodium antiporter [Blautia sp.]|nr:calcium/sodium antiporter [Blautia sp.]
MFVQILIMLASLAAVLIGADYLVDGSSAIGRKAGLSEFIIGITIVGIGTSAPEMAVSFVSAFSGNADIAVGNVVGSNIYNTFLILGITAIISPLAITKENLNRDIPVNIIATILFILLGLSGTIFGSGDDILGRGDGAILLVLFAAYMAICFWSGKSDDSEEESDEKQISIFKAIIMIVSGLAMLVVGGKFFVSSATEIARLAHIPETFIAITIVAGGTSLPELATCIVAAFKGKDQLALGNIIGSNIANILLILGGSALICPLSLQGISMIDIGTLFLSAIFIFASAYLFKKGKLDRAEGVIFTLTEIAYVSWLIIQI